MDTDVIDSSSSDGSSDYDSSSSSSSSSGSSNTSSNASVNSAMLDARDGGEEDDDVSDDFVVSDGHMSDNELILDALASMTREERVYFRENLASVLNDFRAAPSGSELPRRCQVEGSKFKMCKHSLCWDKKHPHLLEFDAFSQDRTIVRINSDPACQERSSGRSLYEAYSSWFTSSRRQGAELLTSSAFYRCLHTQFCAKKSGPNKPWMFYGIFLVLRV